MSIISEIIDHQEKFEILLVTPSDAARLLEKSNFDNRKLRSSVVRKYASMIINGHWQLSPETISISKTGRLLNGQHRLSAVVESGVAARFVFATGFDDSVFEVIDRGASRSTSDSLRIDRKLSEAATILAKMANGVGARIAPSDFDIKAAAEKISEPHSRVIEFCPTARAIFSTAPFRLACAGMVMSGQGEYALKLYRDLVLSRFENLPPIGHALVKQVMNRKIQSTGGLNQLINFSVAWDVFKESSADKTRLYSRININSFSEILEVAGYAKS